MDYNWIGWVRASTIREGIILDGLHDVGKMDIIVRLFDVITIKERGGDNRGIIDAVNFKIKGANTLLQDILEDASRYKVIFVGSTTATVVGGFDIIIFESVFANGVTRIETTKVTIDLRIEAIHGAAFARLQRG